MVLKSAVDVCADPRIEQSLFQRCTGLIEQYLAEQIPCSRFYGVQIGRAGGGKTEIRLARGILVLADRVFAACLADRAEMRLRMDSGIG